jgi:hypothetical protein
MAQRTEIRLTCDYPHVEITGRGKNREEKPVSVPGVTTHTVIIDGEPREIDVCQEHDTEVTAALKPVVEYGRKVSWPESPLSARRTRRVGRSTGGKGAASTPSGDVRSWARDNGYQISERGRIPASILEAYRDAETSGRLEPARQEQEQEQEQETVNA